MRWMDVNEYLGGHYRDEDTKFEGVATAVTFYRNRCERVCLTALVAHVPVEHWFDEPQLVRIDVEGMVLGFANGQGR